MPLAAIGLASLGLAACDLTTSEEAMRARLGQPLNTVIADWGFPTSERTIAGRNLVVWEETEVTYDGVPQIGIGGDIGNASVTATIPLGEPRELSCNRVLQINRQEIVIGASLEGNNCPFYAPSNW